MEANQEMCILLSAGVKSSDSEMQVRDEMEENRMVLMG